MWRKPDKSYKDEWGVWYGPNGEEGEHATEVEAGGPFFAVREFTFVGTLIDDCDPDFPFLCIETTIKAGSLQEAVGLGVLKIAEQGGEESFVSELPR